MPTLEKKEFFNSLLLNGFCFAVALYVIYDIICHSADLQVHLGDQMQPSVQCGRKKNCGPNGACRVRVQGNICESNFWQLLKVEFCKYVEKCLRWKLIWHTPACTQTAFTCIHYWSGIPRVSVQSHIVDIYETFWEITLPALFLRGYCKWQSIPHSSIIKRDICLSFGISSCCSSSRKDKQELWVS